MNIEFSKRADRFGSNIFNILNEKKNDRLAQGKPVYNFTVGTPDFKPDESVMKVVSEAALDPENYKYSLGDTDELLEVTPKSLRIRKKILDHTIRMAIVEFEKLPLEQDVAILRNILYEGVWTAYERKQNHDE